MDWPHLDDFLALAKTGSFRRAADMRHVTQPAFSRRIQALEDQIGTILFDRTVVPVDLTPAGRRFLAHAAPLAKALSKAVEDTRGALTALENPVRFVTSHTLAVSFFPDWWRQTSQTLPDLSVRLTGQRLEQCVPDVQDGMADFAIIHTTATLAPYAQAEGLTAKQLAHDQFVPVMPPHLMGQNVGLLGYAPDSFLGQCTSGLLSDMARHRRPEIVFESPSSEVLRAMALAGFGMAFLPHRLIAGDMAAGTLVPAMPKRFRMDMRIMALRRTTALPAHTQRLWAFMADMPLAPA